MTSSTNMAPITIGGHTRWNSLSRGTGSSCTDDAGTEGPIFDVRRRELVTLFGGGLAAMPDDYFIGPQLGRPRPWPIELDRDPTVSERALGPATRSSAVQKLGPLSIKFRLLARLFINH
jgi:hypothetical protein